MRAPDDNSSEATCLRFQSDEIAYAALVGTTVVVDDENVTRARRLHRFEENIDTTEMFCWKRAPGKMASGGNRLNPTWRDPQRHVQTQRRVGNERRGKLGKFLGELTIVQCSVSFSSFTSASLPRCSDLAVEFCIRRCSRLGRCGSRQ